MDCSMGTLRTTIHCRDDRSHPGTGSSPAHESRTKQNIFCFTFTSPVVSLLRPTTICQLPFHTSPYAGFFKPFLHIQHTPPYFSCLTIISRPDKPPNPISTPLTIATLHYQLKLAHCTRPTKKIIFVSPLFQQKTTDKHWPNYATAFCSRSCGDLLVPILWRTFRASVFHPIVNTILMVLLSFFQGLQFC